MGRDHAADLLDHMSELAESLYERGWASDGLAVIPPTRRLVDSMLDSARADSDQLVAVIPPRGGLATLRTIAANAVMAGCRPEYFPVVVAAIRAMNAAPFGLSQIQATTHTSAPLAIVNGPIRHKLGMNSGAGLFGPGNRANATIGRAIRLILLNVGGGLPVSGDRSTFGHPGKYTFCIAENEEASPWPALSATRGFSREEDVVTLIACEAPRSVADHSSEDGRGILRTIAGSLADKGHNNAYLMGEIVVVIGLEHAKTLAAEGWSKKDVQQFLFENARMPVSWLREGGLYGIEVWPKWIDRSDPEQRVPVVDTPDRFIVLVAGGEAGRFSAIMPGWGHLSVSVSAPIDVTGHLMCRIEGGGQCEPAFVNVAGSSGH